MRLALMEVTLWPVSAHEIAEAVMDLPETERLGLARRIVASVAVEREATEKITQAVRGIEDLLTGKVRGLSEEEFQNSLR